MLAVVMLSLVTAVFASGNKETVYDVTAVAGADGVNYLTDGEGMTLYYFTKDVNGTSLCVDGCLDKWPVFYSELTDPDPSLSASDFSTITRDDGSKQTSYMGWPLYYFVADEKPGDRKGDGVNAVWFVVPAGSFDVTIATDPGFGNYLVDGQGNSLYLFTNDSANLSNCAGDCLANWPAFYAENPAVPSALNPADFGVVTRADGVLQSSYKGQPLYYFVADKTRGDIAGQGIKDVWYLIAP